MGRGLRFGPSIPPQGELLFFFDAEEAGLVPDSKTFNSFIGDGFPVPELKGGSEASENDIVSNEALHVIGLHGSGDKISRYLQDWEVAKVAPSSHTATQPQISGAFVEHV